MIKTMNSKMTTNSQLSTTVPKTQNQNQNVEQEQNHRNGDHVEGYHQGGREGAGEWGERYKE